MNPNEIKDKLSNISLPTLGGKEGALSTMSTSLQDLSKNVKDVANKGKEYADMGKGAINDLSNGIKSATAGIAEVSSQIKSIASDAVGALNEQVSFVTQATRSAIDSTKSFIDDVVNSEDGFGANVKFAIKVAKETIKDATGKIKDGISAVKAVTDEVKKEFQSAKEEIGKLKQEVEDTVNGVVNEVNGAISDVVNTVSSTINDVKQAAGDIVNTGQKLYDDAINNLPKPIRGWAQKATEGKVNKIFDKLSGAADKLTSTIVRKIPGIKDDPVLSNILTNVLNRPQGPFVTNQHGGDASALFGNSLERNDINGLYELARTICSGVTTPNTLDYNANKNLYDVLLQYAAMNGMTDLIDQLIECSGGSAKYYDKYSKILLKTLLPGIAGLGNPHSYDAIQRAIGNGNVPDAKDNLKQLIASTPDTPANNKELETVVKNSQLSVEELVGLPAPKGKKNTIDHPVSAVDVTLLCVNNTKLVDKAIGKENRQLAQAAIAIYG